MENMGFEINPYDLCVANKMVSGHQMTICWHVDDLKVSHKNEAMLYVRLRKALYGMLRAALLFYKILRSDLENMGFEITHTIRASQTRW